jgi:hypothetical protein
MLEYHSNKLLQICQHALTRKALVLQTYVYLHDADTKGFYHESMTESLWDRFAAMSSESHDNNGNGGGGGVGGGGNGRGKVAGKEKEKIDKADDKRPKCSHCRNLKYHELAKVSPFKGACPLLEVTDFAKARAIAKQAVALFLGTPNGPFS